ncbi:Eco57I restriction-modification methylase [Lachnospiraceae bacterium NE2001]|nr:Eco57I restriction-modification methylase [Lachnospiraceae bacterium NE2001]
MKFDFVIGNPPYQEETKNSGDRPNPIYNNFMDAAYSIADTVELITPARFLFNAGQTPKAWNEKMLSDEHLRVLSYEADASKVFSTTDIKGGVAITIRDKNKLYGAIGVFTVYNELNGIIRRVSDIVGDSPRLDSIIASQGLYRFSSRFFVEHPEIKDISGKGTGNKIVSSFMEKMPDVFCENPQSSVISVKMLGRIKGKREYRYINRDYLEENNYIDSFNLFFPEANNSGQFGETLTEPTVGLPGEGASDTFLSAGQFDSIEKPLNLLKYFKTKFFRTLLGARKVTQHCPQIVWKMIPLQDFSLKSDINWSKSIREIDQQLYKKYGLSKEEIEFIETNVKEME